MIKKQVCKWICVLVISLNIAMINGVEELKQMTNTAKKLQHNVFIRMLMFISLIIYIEEIIFEGLLSEAYKWMISVVISLCTVPVVGLEGIKKLTSFLMIFTPNLILSILGVAFIYSVYRCVQIRVKIKKGDCVKKDMHTLVASYTFLWIDMYLNYPEFVNLVEVRSF